MLHRANTSHATCEPWSCKGEKEDFESGVALTNRKALSSECRRGGRGAQRSIRVGEDTFAESFKAQGGCAKCGVPREFCDRWEKSSDDNWQLQPLTRCQYGRLVYDTVVGLIQRSDREYAEDLLITIKEQGEEDYRDIGDEVTKLTSR